MPQVLLCCHGTHYFAIPLSPAQVSQDLERKHTTGAIERRQAINLFKAGPTRLRDPTRTPTPQEISLTDPSLYLVSGSMRDTHARTIKHTVPPYHPLTNYIMYKRPDRLRFYPFIPTRCRNSSRVSLLVSKHPSMQLVKVVALVFSTPRITIHRWLDSMTTATPWGCTTFVIA